MKSSVDNIALMCRLLLLPQPTSSQNIACSPILQSSPPNYAIVVLAACQSFDCSSFPNFLLFNMSYMFKFKSHTIHLHRQSEHEVQNVRHSKDLNRHPKTFQIVQNQ
jgi:hypothetical protein